MLRAQRIENAHQFGLGAIQLPVAGKKTAVLVAVAVAQHDVLLGPRAHHHVQHTRQRVEVAHDAGRVPQIANGFKERHHDQIALRACIEFTAHQAGFFLQHQQFEQVAHVFGVRDDVVTQGGPTISAQHVARQIEDGEFAYGKRAVGCMAHPQRTRFMQQLHEHSAFARFVQ